MIEQRGYRVAGAVRAAALAPNVDLITPDTPALCVFDVSRPLTFPFIASEFAALKALMGDRAPILLYGARPRRELHELGTSTGAAEVVSDETAFFTSVERLMPKITARPPSASVRLLLIDDSELTLEIMQMKLQRSGFDVRIAVALEEVNSLVWGWAPHIVIADVKRPDVPGHQLCMQLKASVGAQVVVALCSSVAEDNLASLARISGADAYVSKSGGLDTFVAEVEALAGALQTRSRNGVRATTEER